MCSISLFVIQLSASQYPGCSSVGPTRIKGSGAYLQSTFPEFPYFYFPFVVVLDLQEMKQVEPTLIFISITFPSLSYPCYYSVFGIHIEYVSTHCLCIRILISNLKLCRTCEKWRRWSIVLTFRMVWRSLKGPSFSVRYSLIVLQYLYGCTCTASLYCYTSIASLYCYSCTASLYCCTCAASYCRMSTASQRNLATVRYILWVTMMMMMMIRLLTHYHTRVTSKNLLQWHH